MDKKQVYPTHTRFSLKLMFQRAKELIGNSERLQKISDDLIDEFRRRKAIWQVIRTKPKI